MPQNRPLSVQEVAEFLDISKNTVYDLIRRGELVSYRVGRKVRVDMQDIEAYKNKSRTDAAGRLLGTLHTPPSSAIMDRPAAVPVSGAGSDLIISGQDMLLDLLAQDLRRSPYNFRALRSYIGSYDSLLDLYKRKATIASVHLWDGMTDEYNVPYVRYLLPGISCLIVNLCYRMQGFYVAKGNPKKLERWEDLTRPGVVMVNREIGCGVRVLIDESLSKLGLSASDISGYHRYDTSHLAVASVVSRGEADVAVGNEKSALQVGNIDFIPIQKERLDLVIPKSTPRIFMNAVMETLHSKSFRDEINGIGGYDISQIGEVIAET